MTGAALREVYYRRLDELLLHSGAQGVLLSAVLAWGASELGLRIASGGTPRDTPTVISFAALSWLWIGVTSRMRDRRRRGATDGRDP